MRIQNTVIVSVYGGVVQDIATDLDPDGVRFILVDHDNEQDDFNNGHEDVNASPITAVFNAERRRELGIDDCRADADAQSHHEHGVSDCRSPQLWRRQVTDDLEG
ncbi:hypothetical protein LCGC14_0657770 [marine sediment metagenome]|uniref:Uncharacterized protein n=1 Tax=marine sediment metagenome TaxID=412755 RepID=A0A0F9U2V8_9ZZZZ